MSELTNKLVSGVNKLKEELLVAADKAEAKFEEIAADAKDAAQLAGDKAKVLGAAALDAAAAAAEKAEVRLNEAAADAKVVAAAAAEKAKAAGAAAIAKASELADKKDA